MAKTIAEAMVSMRADRYARSSENLAWEYRGLNHRLASIYASRSGMGEMTELQLFGLEVEGKTPPYSANIKFVNGYGVEVRRGVRGSLVGGELVITTTLPDATSFFYPVVKSAGHWYYKGPERQRVSVHPEFLPVGLFSVINEFLKQL